MTLLCTVQCWSAAKLRAAGWWRRAACGRMAFHSRHCGFTSTQSVACTASSREKLNSGRNVHNIFAAVTGSARLFPHTQGDRSVSNLPCGRRCSCTCLQAQRDHECNPRIRIVISVHGVQSRSHSRCMYADVTARPVFRLGAAAPEAADKARGHTSGVNCSLFLLGAFECDRCAAVV